MINFKHSLDSNTNLTSCMINCEHSLDSNSNQTNHHKSKDSTHLVLKCTAIRYRSKDSTPLVLGGAMHYTSKDST